MWRILGEELSNGSTQLLAKLASKAGGAGRGKVAARPGPAGVRGG